MRKLIMAAAGACLFGGLATTASAAPAAFTHLKTEAAGVDLVTYGRNCWRHHGHWHCRGARYSYDAPYYYGYAPYYGPSVGLYFGGGRYGHGHGHRR